MLAMFNILQVRLQQYVNQELPDTQGRFRKGRGTGDWIANIHWIIEKASEFQYIYFCFIDYARVFECWITTNCGRFLEMVYQTTLPASWETCMQVRKQQVEPDMEQQTGSKLGKEYIKAVYCHPAYLTYMLSACVPAKLFQSCPTLGTLASWDMPGWMNHKLEWRLPGEISITSDMQTTLP